MNELKTIEEKKEWAKHTFPYLEANGVGLNDLADSGKEYVKKLAKELGFVNEQVMYDYYVKEMKLRIKEQDEIQNRRGDHLGEE